MPFQAAVVSFLAVTESLSSAAASSPSAVAPSPAAAGWFLPAVVPAPCPRPLPLSSGNPVAPFRNASFPFRAPDKSVCGAGSETCGGRKRTDSEYISYLYKNHSPRKFRFGLLPRVVLAIGLGVGCGFFFPERATRIALTFNDIFGQFLSFVIPLLILGLVAPGIADLGKTAGWLLAVTAALAYAFTLFSGFGTYLVGRAVFPALLEGSQAVLPDDAGAALTPYFTVQMPPLFGVMSALVLAFVLGLGMAYTHSVKLKGVMDEFKGIIERVIGSVII